MVRQIRVDMEKIKNDLSKRTHQIISKCNTKDKKQIRDEANNIAKTSSNFLLTAFEFPYRQVDREGPSQLLICVATEMILNAIIILEDPDEYVSLYKKKNQPPTFEEAKKSARKIIVKDFNQRQKERMIDVLDLIQSKRNIFAHFSLSFHAYYYQHYEMLNAIEYLFSRYFPCRRGEIKKLKEMKERFRFKDDADYDYVNFETL